MGGTRCWREETYIDSVSMVTTGTSLLVLNACARVAIAFTKPAALAEALPCAAIKNENMIERNNGEEGKAKRKRGQASVLYVCLFVMQGG